MTKPSKACIVCGAPTLAANRICKRDACKEERARRRIIYIPESENKLQSGTYMALNKCTHGTLLTEDCERCDDEWEEAQNEPGELPSNPRINVK
jgi:hypothetical protein